MALKAARFANLFLVGVLTGNEFGSWAGLHPALRELPHQAYVRSEQAVTRRFGKMMPALTSSMRWPARPIRCRPLVTDGGASICTTRSMAPMSIPSSRDDVATSAFRRPALSRSSISIRCARASDP